MIETIINTYAKCNKFVIIKCHKDLNIINKTIIRCYIYQCWKTRINNSKKVKDITLYYNNTLTKINYL